MKQFKTNYLTLLCSSLTFRKGNSASSIVYIDEKYKECYKWRIKIK